MKLSYDENNNIIGYGDCIVKPIGGKINREKNYKKVKTKIKELVEAKKLQKEKRENAISDLIAKSK